MTLSAESRLHNNRDYSDLIIDINKIVDLDNIEIKIHDARGVVILDLDRTLIVSTKVNIPATANIDGLQVDDPNFIYGSFFITIDGDVYVIQPRPYLKLFLQILLKYFDVGIWSAGTSEYVRKIVDKIFPSDNRPCFILTRISCLPVFDSTRENNTAYVKRLSMFWNIFPKYNQSNTFLIDDDELNYDANKENTLLAPEFSGDRTDRFLFETLLRLLESINSMLNK